MHCYGLGRLTREVELKSSTSGTSYLSNSVACDRKYGEKKTDFFNIKAFGKTAEAMDRYLRKGSRIFVEGDLQIDEYTDKAGNKRQTTVIAVSSWEFADSKSEKAEAVKPNDEFLKVTLPLEELPFS